MLNVGLIGLGKMGRLHMMNCLHIDDVKLVAAADPLKRVYNKATGNFQYHERFVSLRLNMTA